jgi:hypothetical protein
MPVHREVELGQRVQTMGVAPELGHEYLRLERAHQWRDHGVEGPQPTTVPGVRG